MTRIIALALAALLAAGTSASVQRNLPEQIIWDCIQNPRACSGGEYRLTIVSNSDIMISSIKMNIYGDNEWMDPGGSRISDLASKETHSWKLRQGLCSLRITWANGYTKERLVNDACNKPVLMALE
jgi:hypothetical protein